MEVCVEASAYQLRFLPLCMPSGACLVKRCEVCRERPRRHRMEPWSEMCDECYDSFHARAGQEGSVVWAARRARRYERARQRRGK